MKDSPCKDCSCETIYRKIERPKTYQFGVDSDQWTIYWVPVDDYADVAGADYFTSYDEMETDYNSTALVASLATKFLSQGPDFEPVHNTIEEAITYLDAFDYTFGGTRPAGSYYWTRIQVNNPNYGKELQHDSSVLSWPINQDAICYDELKDPFWKIKFPICGSNGKKDKDNTFKFKDCGIWNVEYRLRLRPLVFFGWPEDGDACADHWLESGEEVDNTENRTKLWNTYRFYSAMKEQAGAKYLGMTKLRLETGIFNEDSQTEKPIVWSEGKYPQPVIKYKDYWDSNYENGKYLYYKECSPTQWEGMHPHLISSDMEETEVVYKQFNYSFTSGSVSEGLFEVTTNDFDNPGDIILSKKSQLKGDQYNTADIPLKYRLDEPDRFFSSCLENQYASPTGDVEIVQRAFINGEWKKLRKVSYSLIEVVENPTSVTLDVDAGTVINYDVGNIEDTDIFYNGTTYKTKYEILVSIEKVTKSVPKMDYANVTIGNVTELTDDFVYELEGFTHVDMDKQKEISIYLKALPDSPSGHPLEHNTGFTMPGISSIQPTKNGSDPAIINESDTMPEKYWPWGVLSADERTGYQEQFKKVYEPLLPIRPDLIDFDATGTGIIDNVRAGQAYRWGHVLSDENWIGRKNPFWYIMIEEGWIRLTKTCEGCCD